MTNVNLDYHQIELCAATLFHSCIVFLFLRPVFSRGDHTLNVPMRMFQENRERLCERLRNAEGYQPGSVVLLEGGISEMRHSSDHELLFRQVLYFCCYYWL